MLHTADIAHDERVRNVHATDIDEGGAVTSLGIGGCQTDNEATASNCNRNGIMQTTLLDPVGG
jgi:hypothetical protein